MAVASGAPENLDTPEDLSIKRTLRNDAASVTQTEAESPAETQEAPAQQHQSSTGDEGEVPVKLELKEEVEEREAIPCCDTSNEIESHKGSLLGKVKIKPMESLVETSVPNPQPKLHPFFAGFDDHIRSLIMSQQPQFAMNSPLMTTPPQFMYYDNSTNIRLKNMLNGHKMAQAPTPKHAAYRPYVPINVPRPPRSQIPLRTSFSTQTPPMFSGDPPDAPSVPSTSYKWLPQSRPPLPAFIPQNDLTSLKNISVPNVTPTNILPTPKITPSNNLTATNLGALNSPLNFPLPQTFSLPNVAPKPPNKVSTSSSTDDLEKHSSENSVTIKTEVDLGVDSKEELQATLNECTELEPHFMDADSKIQVSNSMLSNLMTPSTSSSNLILTGDTVAPPVKPVPKPHPEYQLPAYSTRGALLCKCCDFRCNRKKKMKEHFDSMHTAENHFKCFYCIKKLGPLTFHKTVHDLEHHVGKVHRGEKRWQCKSCSKTYKCQASYKAHVEKMCSQSHPYACHMCTFTCVTEAALEKHIKSHEKLQETLECPFCNKVFKKFYLKQHLITVHAPPEEKPFHCMSCDFATGTQAVLENHYRRSGHDKKFKCDKCDFAGRHLSLLKRHIRAVHKMGDDSLVCGVDGCQARYSNLGNLRSHRRLHSLPDSECFSCPDKECSKKFAAEQSLRHHLSKTRHHKTFKCPDCTHRFLKEESLNKHIQIVHVPLIMKKMEKPSPKEPVCIKNVVDVYKYVESGGMVHAEARPSTYGEDDSMANFGCWLGISGFGDIAIKTDCDNQAPSEANNPESVLADVEVKQMEEEEEEEEEEEGDYDDEDYKNLVPITCLVELKQDETDDASNASLGNDHSVALFVKNEDGEDMEDPEYQYVKPEISCLVECQQNSVDSSTTCNENQQLQADCLPTS